MYNLSDPVFVAEGGWDQGKVGRPVPVITPEGWVMVYAGSDINQRGIVTSQDGINWTPYFVNPVLTSEDFPISGKTWDTALVYHSGTFYFYMEIGNLSRTNIYLFTHTGSLP
jgi:hypothetical protein